MSDCLLGMAICKLTFDSESHSKSLQMNCVILLLGRNLMWFLFVDPSNL